jgi:hypothetical protein
MALRLTDEQWERIREHFPEENIPDGRPGRKPIPTRKALEGYLVKQFCQTALKINRPRNIKKNRNYEQKK